MNFTTFSPQKKISGGEYICYCKEVEEQTVINAIKTGSTSLRSIKESTAACTGNACKEKNPKGRCCSVEINALIKFHKDRRSI